MFVCFMVSVSFVQHREQDICTSVQKSDHLVGNGGLNGTRIPHPGRRFRALPQNDVSTSRRFYRFVRDTELQINPKNTIVMKKSEVKLQ